jgi:hypothetical protein
MNQQLRLVCTSGRLPCTARSAWDKVCFYEHIATQPSLLLRSVLPVPLRTSGAYRKAGDESRCLYSDGGYLTKKIEHIVAGERIDFEIIEQSIRYADRCSVRMLTRYQLRGAARLIPRICIDYVIAAMHRIVIRDMQVRLAPAASATQVSPQRADQHM